jgi:hypothetical protein
LLKLFSIISASFLANLASRIVPKKKIGLDKPFAIKGWLNNFYLPRFVSLTIFHVSSSIIHRDSPTEYHLLAHHSPLQVFTSNKIIKMLSLFTISKVLLKSISFFYWIYFSFLFIQLNRIVIVLLWYSCTFIF